MPPTTTPALRIENLTKSFGSAVVVDDLSLDIREGEIFGLLGPNGAGKSTTINLVSGVSKIQKGKISAFGFDNQTHFATTRRIIGVMHQEVVIEPNFTIGKALKIHSGLYGVSDDKTWRETLIDRLSLGPHMEKRMVRLSGGMKRRFMVAKALIHKPRLLILDEPTAGVDVDLRRALWEFVREINLRGTTVLLTTHYLEEAEQMCGRIGIMNHGKIVAVDTTTNLMDRLEKLRLRVTMKAPLWSLPSEIAPFDSHAIENNRVWEFSLRNKSDSGNIVEALAKFGIEEVETQTPRLEDVFLKLTRAEAGT